MGTESERVASFGRLEDGLRQASDCAFWYQLTLAGGGSAELRLRLRPATASAAKAAAALGAEFSQVMAARRAEADEFYAELTPATANADEATVMRQAFAGLLWSKQLYYYDAVDERDLQRALTMGKQFADFIGDELTIEYPTGSGRQLTLDRVGRETRP